MRGTLPAVAWRPGTWLVPIVLGTSACIPGSSREEAPPQVLRDVIELCDAFLAAPEDVDPAPILQFMAESPEIHVVTGPHLDGVATGKDVPEWASSMLLAGYIAGNMRAQLIAGKKQDNPVAGFRGVLAVYRALQPKGLQLPDIEELAAADERGSLDSWAQARFAE